MDLNEIKYFIESALLAAGRPLNIDQIKALFEESSAPEKSQLREAIESLKDDYVNRGIEIGEVASGFRMQVNASMAERLHKLWDERPPRYSRALFETLALIAYRQPMTRGEIEEVRGVSVSTNIVRSLMEREWIRVVGHRDVPGRPALFGTTKLFLDYFGLKKLDDLPPLADLSDWETLRVQLNLPAVEEDAAAIEAADITGLPVMSLEGVTDQEDLMEDPMTEVPSVDGNISVLKPELESEADVEPDVVEEAVTVLHDSRPEQEFEEIVATEWPDSASTGILKREHEDGGTG